MFRFCLSLLLHRVRVIESDFHNLQGDIIQQLNRHLSEGDDGKMAKMCKRGRYVNDYMQHGVILDIALLRFMPLVSIQIVLQ